MRCHTRCTAVEPHYYVRIVVVTYLSFYKGNVHSIGCSWASIKSGNLHLMCHRVLFNVSGRGGHAVTFMVETPA